MRKSKRWYEDAHGGDEAMKKYYKGVYAQRKNRQVVTFEL